MALSPVELADRLGGVVQQIQREVLLVGLHQQAIDQGPTAGVQVLLTGGAAARPGERRQVPRRRGLHGAFR